MTITLPKTSTYIPSVPQHGTESAEEAIFEALSFLQKSWHLNGSQVASLLHLKISTVNHWLSNGRVPIGKPPFSPTSEAVLNLLAIHRSLFAMFSDPANQVTWLKTKHPQLSEPPLSIMKQSSAGLLLVRQYLDYIRGRGA